MGPSSILSDPATPSSKALPDPRPCPLTTTIKDPEGLKARKAFSEFSRDLKMIDTGPSADASEAHNQISEALREYLGKKFMLTAGAITYQDVAELLTKSGVTPDTVTSLKHILDQCEAHRFAGNTVTRGDLSNLLADALETAGRIEQQLK
ncbi:MAG: hypothetical protein U9O82_10280 [Thermodesulfobacteriota bacterium]|nr:hypothetical protein [Thermodesulfobacteriota bacterium]